MFGMRNALSANMMNVETKKGRVAKLNPFEFQARILKVDAIVSKIPAGVSTFANINTANMMRTWTQTDRNVFARFAGQRTPSGKTWEMVCDWVAGRKV